MEDDEQVPPPSPGNRGSQQEGDEQQQQQQQQQQGGMEWINSLLSENQGQQDEDENLLLDDANRARFPSETEESTSSIVVQPLPPLIPRREEPTLKEKLVERERQARVETERARLKRQFALSSNGGDAAMLHEGGAGAGSSSNEVSIHHALLARENGSVEGTVGEGSSVAAPPTEEHNGDEDDADDGTKQQQLGYVMERFLRGDVEEKEEQVEQAKPEPGVLMARFLAEPVVVEHEAAVAAQVSTEENNVEKGGGDDVKLPADENVVRPSQVTLQHGNAVMGDDGQRQHMSSLPPSVGDTGPIDSHDGTEVEATAGSIRSYSTVTNASLAQVSTMDVDGVLVVEDSPTTAEASATTRENEPESSSTDERPRVRRLTEAEIQEMAAIEEASIGNAPPSERDDTFSDSSLVGDLVGDLLNDAPVRDPTAGDFSERTHTTALESATITSADGDDLSERSSPLEIEAQSVDAMEPVSVSSHLVVSPGASSEGSVSITACPPSVTDPEEPSILGPDGDVVVLPHSDLEGSTVLEMLSFENNASDLGAASLDCAPSFEDAGGPRDLEAATAVNSSITNRQVRPGRVPVAQMPATPDTGHSAGGASTTGKRVQIMLDDFDFDKNSHDLAANTPHSRGMDSYNELPGDDPWSPGPGQMNLSPLHPRSNIAISAAVTSGALAYPRLEETGAVTTSRDVATYGSVEIRREGVAPPATRPEEVSLKARDVGEGDVENERLPLVGYGDEDGEISHIKHAKDNPELGHTLSHVFSSLRSESTTTIEAVNTDSEAYLATGFFKRAFPERFFALIVTLIVEIPVLLMISGGSDRLCMLIGRRRYQLMMGFLPLSSAISGNCGLQASTLTTRAVSHDHVTKSTYMIWLIKEVAAAGCLGVGMGCVLGSYAYFVSGMDYAFGLTIFMAQFVSIITAGLTGTLAPLIFTFIFHRDSALYGGPLETAIQDIVGSFAMVVLSYHLLVFFGPMEISPDDICGQQD